MNPDNSASGGADWRINEVATELIVTEGVGSLGPQDVRKIVKIVLEHLSQEQRRSTQHERDTDISDRAYHSDVE